MKRITLGILFLGNLAALASGPQEITEKMRQAKDRLETQEKRSRQVLSTLYQIQSHMKANVKRKFKLLQQQSQLQQVLNQTQEQIKEQDKLVNLQRNQLGQRIKSISQIKSQSLFQVLLSSQSPHQLDKNMKILSLIAERDVQLVKQYNTSVKKLGLQRQQIAKRIEKMKALEVDLLGQEKSFSEQQASRKIILDRFQKDKKVALRKIEQLRQASLDQNQEDLGLLDPLLKPSFLNKKGQLIWPIEGELTQHFGLEKSKESHLQLYNKGIFIKAAKGSVVKAVAEGKVVYSGEVQGLGRTVILDHGDHFYTVYANAQDIFVNINAQVQENQKIASVTEAPFDKESGLYFEVRHFSEPTDPASWMKGSTL